ncbi:M24 family metallopeptidase [Acrocarpospora catenulata]|uniref:M24 family metallopeptidase n=1 Tax=Acrocarpospora catenulata TaxID=2836182 RepID=UPI001BDB39FC|nr:M24 family metallopeptidase [Acrocarpospora catenulata]
MENAFPKAGHALAPEDVAEYERRVAAVRAAMRQKGLDALVVGDNPYGLEAGFRAGAYLSGFGLRWPLYYTVVVLPLEGEATLVLSPGPGGGALAKARDRTWIKQIVGTSAKTPEENARTFFGLLGATYDQDVIPTLKGYGLEQGRIGTIGAWPGLEETKAALPNASFEIADSILKGIATTINSAWEETQLTYSQRAAEATMRALAEAAQPGVTYRDAFRAMYRTLVDHEMNAYPLFSVMTGEGKPWWPFDPGYELPDDRIREGDMIGGELPVTYRGWHVQYCRTWVVGEPSKAQTHVLDGLKAVQETMRDRCRVGMTGDALWKVTLDACDKYGFEPIARSGHWIGYWSAGELGKISGDRDGHFQETSLQFMPDNPMTVEEGMAVVIHPTVVHRATNYFGILGDTGIVRNGNVEYLTSPSELP